ncbi:MAG TPA: helix-turn-helix domain-containing protein [Thermodesulfobacteriota bacterium]|nr:helix-turn-helix domain-containing protein [Thermodesulfobacteriota bacterium]
MSEDDFLTTGEAAKLVTISRSTISRNFDKGIFQGKKNPITGERLISRQSLIEFLKQYNVPYDALIVAKKKVLLGTADDQLLSLVQRSLADDTRVEIERVTYGGDVLMWASKMRPNLLIVDEELADIPTSEVIRSLRRLPDMQQLKIICFAETRGSRKGLEWGADQVLAREGLVQEELTRNIYSLLGVEQAAPAADQGFNHQRRWPRLAIHLPLKIGIYPLRTPYRRDAGTATMENISLGGAYLSELKLDSGMLPCEPFRLSLSADQEPLKDWKAHCKVVRLTSNGALSAGVQFTRVPKASMKILQDAAASLQ